MSMSITDYSGAAAAALAGLNNVTSQMTDVQNQLNTGKAVNGYADNPSVFYAATLMNRQVDALKSSATDLNANLTNINSALTTATSVANTLGSIRDNVSKMTAVGTTAAQAASYATTINTLINSINASVADAITAAASTGKRSLLDNANNDMNITVGNGTMTVNAADMAVAAGDNPDGTRPKGLAIGFTAQDVQNLLTIIKAGAKAGAPTTTTASVTLSASATAPASSTTKDLLSTTSVSYKLASTTNGSSTYTKTTIVTPMYGATTAAQQFLATVNTAIANVDNYNQQWGGAVQAINNLLSNNTALQSSLSGAVSNLVDADMSAEQAKLQALQFQQQVSVSAVSSINSSREALLSLFR